MVEEETWSFVIGRKVGSRRVEKGSLGSLRGWFWVVVEKVV